MSGKVRDYTRLAKDILEAVGGEENVIGASRCATRLRLVLKRSKPQAKDIVKAMPGVITVVENSGQFQIVIGQHVGDVFEAFSKLVNIDLSDEQSENKGTILNRVIATMSAVFAPFVYILAAAGILQGALIIINLLFDGFEKTGTYQVFSFISWAPFTFLPIFIAITASKHFKTNTYIAVACCAALVSPTWAEMATQIADGKSISFLGIALSQTTYTSSVLPPLFLVWMLSYLERFLNKRMNEVVRPLFVPFLCMVIMVPVTIVLIGPVTTLGANGIANGYNFLAENVPALAGAIIGAFWQVIVIFGVHWGITPMVLANFDLYGRDSFQAYQTIAVVAQVGAVLGVILKARNKETRKVSVSAGVTGLFGITEPAIYGVTLRFKKPFIFGCISGAVGAVVASFFHPYYFAYAGLPGPLTIVNGINEKFPTSIWGILIGAAIAVILPVVLIQIFGYGEDTAAQTEKDNLLAEQANEETVYAPFSGKVIPLSKVPDEVFSSGAMGQGLAIEPSDSKLYAPFDGTIVMVAPTKHAIGLRSTSGVELLVHIGLDTVTLDGTPFSLKVKEGDTVKKGEVLAEFDKAFIEQKGLTTITPVIITNSHAYQEILIEDLEESALDQKIFTVVS
ncbi:beta-glucoside-specific PTS transporter subunit IIABC [Bacillus halotolerans]|uniref:beta-glucoside-specific PTS transporter subunit IIABC n=1 Tax=Bacillus halotolerans TaxID=260554 RepID=UPI000FD6D73B|nr:beta-glucoside-specific PTS transporter subunit IIABC [Bacillus halotolerans]MBV7321238.1 beta-glucoside-specific PTS transporter subunit IIABC [Halalkalibacterium halodurans]AZV49449.1 PTS beta-glucoside transporter subunit EIIBCA [Bacillus halotolerans]MEC3637406.1 beta-glucoside-specific PTS transporter subunit IIABC [Bacillus halotolerans]QDK67407.1 PTS beta-glucoside transporter subunit EIIBCA [Bacillus halotolerans]QNS20224.1 PTS glucose transporter subunit IIA [Bacillus halotolerans]